MSEEMMQLYYWITFAFTLYVCMAIPSKTLDGVHNFGGSVILSLFGFILWPFMAVALYKVMK